MIKRMNYKIIGKYIKELNFNIPNPEAFFLLSKNISNYKIKIDIKSSQVKKNILEVYIALALNPVKENFEKINTKIVYSIIVEISSTIDKKEAEKIILVDVPTKVYSDLRLIFVFLFERSGFKDVKINEIVDFEKLYKLRKV